MRGKVAIETLRGDREAIIVTEIPYQVNKATLVERIAELWREKKIEGIAALRDESDRDGFRVVIEIKRDAMAEIVLNQLYRFTALQSSFGANIVALNGGPAGNALQDLLSIVRRFPRTGCLPAHEIPSHQARADTHVLVGLAIAVANIDEVIRTIRASADANEAREALMPRDWPAADVAALVELIADPRHKVSTDGTYRLSDVQARAILDLRRSASQRWAATRSRKSSTSWPPRSPTISTSCARARASRRSSRTSLRR